MCARSRIFLSAGEVSQHAHSHAITSGIHLFSHLYLFYKLLWFDQREVSSMPIFLHPISLSLSLCVWWLETAHLMLIILPNFPVLFPFVFFHGEPFPKEQIYTTRANYKYIHFILTMLPSAKSYSTRYITEAYQQKSSINMVQSQQHLSPWD